MEPIRIRNTDTVWCNFCKETTLHKKLGPTPEYGVECLKDKCPGKDLADQGRRIKYPPQVLVTMKKKQLANKVSEALGLNEAVDKPFVPKFAGKKLKSASGAHRFDDGVEHTQLKFDDTFSNKADRGRLSP
jgi:hypothetical protein